MRFLYTRSTIAHCSTYKINYSIVLLGHVAIIVYGCLLLCNSLFQEVLKRSGTFEKSKKFSKIRQIWVRKKIQIENSRLEVEIRMSDAAMHRTLMRYCRTVYSCTRPEVVNIWHVCTLCVHCCVRCVHCTIFCVYTVYTVYTSSCTSARSSADFSAVENRRLKTKTKHDEHFCMPAAADECVRYCWVG